MSYKEGTTLNIGALSTAIGVPVETIRTWERRYGFPESERNDAGHRIYKPDTIEYMRLITTILSRGYRPSQLQDRSREQLEELLEKSVGDADSKPHSSAADADAGDGAWLDSWLQITEALDRQRFVGQLRRELSRMNALDFLERRISPMLQHLGEGWVEGQVSVLQEHFATECIRECLSESWRNLSKSASGPPVVLATLPGERHCLGLHMAALTAAMADRPVLFVGADTPVDDIARAQSASGAKAVAISISAYADSTASTSFLTRLRQRVDSDAKILVGGSGAPGGVSGVEVLEDLPGLYASLME